MPIDRDSIWWTQSKKSKIWGRKVVNGDSIPLAPTGANRGIRERDPELQLPGDTNNPNKANVKICDNVARIAVDVRFTLLGPDGPTEPQIIVAMASKDSFATDKNY